MYSVDFTSVFLKQPAVKNGVFVFDSEKFLEFERSYLDVRKLEQRLLSDEEVKSLPIVSEHKPNYQEWKVRQKSTERFLEYYRSKRSPSNYVLDIGCGNGWFSNQLCKLSNSFVLGLDVNIEELSQAQRCFAGENIRFCYMDIFSDVLKQSIFDLITINSAFQYFSQPKTLIDRCLGLLSDHGELHIIDSPFYNESDVDAAKERTNEYYRSLQRENMSDFYFHHTESVLKGRAFTWMYTPEKDQIKDRRTGEYLDCPFPWVRIEKISA